jgi:hypothetical protein
LKLVVGAEVILHEVFDSGLLGEGVLHLLQPQQTQLQCPLPPLMLPARATVYAQLLDMRFEDLYGVNLTLLNPYRFRRDYESSRCHGAHPMSEPFVLDTLDFATEGPGVKSLRPGLIRASRSGVVSAVRLWFVLDFGDAGDAGDGEGPTTLDSRDCHWGYALLYLPEARFETGERVPIAATRNGADYSIRCVYFLPLVPCGSEAGKGRQEVLLSSRTLCLTDSLLFSMCVLFVSQHAGGSGARASVRHPPL